MSQKTNIGIVLRSILHLRPSMIYWRIHRTVKRVVISILTVVDQIGILGNMFEPGATPDSGEIGEISSHYHCEDIDLPANSFSFLNHKEQLPSDKDERVARIAQLPLLWQFHYGYHDYLLALIAQSPADESLRKSVLNFMRSWVSDFPLAQFGSRKSAWHAYVISIRIESWIRLSMLFPNEKFISAHIYQMTYILRHNLEYGTMANHLLKNIKALVLAGLYFDGQAGKNFLEKGMSLLEQELKEQILEDGAHFERSPMYHVAMTSDVLDLIEAMQNTGNAVPEYLSDAASTMTGFLQRVIHPDGEIPFFNDSTASFFLRTEDVLARTISICNKNQWALPAELTENREYPHPERFSGLFTSSGNGFHAVFDAGNVGPDYQPGHAHCDTLSFEISQNNKRFVTDTGVYHYKESRERHNSRSTAAHNSIRINNSEQSEIWKSFRVGRRAKVSDVFEEHRNGLSVIHGCHDGYLSQFGIVHERFFITKAAEWVCVVDMLHGTSDHGIESFLHVAPGVNLQKQPDNFILASSDTTKARIEAFGFYEGGLVIQNIQESEYYPSFGTKLLRPCIRWSGNMDLPAIGAYVIAFTEKIPRVECSPSDMKFRIIDDSGLLYESVSRRS
jgi:heparinase II/III-like protein